MQARSHVVASADEVAELLGDRVDAHETIVERVVDVGASLEEVAEALDDLEWERRFRETREAATPRIEEIRTILEELPDVEDLLTAPTGDDHAELEREP